MRALQLVEAVRSERRRGSTSLAHMVLEAYRALASESIEIEKDMKMFADIFSQLRPSMPLINRFSQEFLKQLTSYTRESLLKACDAVEATYREIQTSLINKAAAVLQGVSAITTLSHSNTVIQTLRKAPGVSRVYILESRPLREGLLAYGELSDVKDVVVMIDAAAGYAVEKSDAALVGADALLPDGSFSGKVGVKNIALHCREQGKPFYVVCDTWKYSERFENEYGPAEDLDWLKSFNPTFERVEAGYVSGYLTEKGFVRPGDVRSHVT